MTTTNTTCPTCGASKTHAEVITDQTAINHPVVMTIHRCPDCGQVWTTSKPAQTQSMKG